MSLLTIIHPLKVKKHNQAAEKLRETRAILDTLRVLSDKAQKLNDPMLDDLILDARIDAINDAEYYREVCADTSIWHKPGNDWYWFY